jgi:hypothetical protein
VGEGAILFPFLEAGFDPASCRIELNTGENLIFEKGMFLRPEKFETSMTFHFFD